jgi:stress-induced-phosphoprotein 1
MSESDKEKEKGNAAFAAKNYDSALNFYTVAIKLHDKNHVLFSNRSVTYLMMGDYTNALQDADSCINLKPDWAKVTKLTCAFT